MHLPEHSGRVAVFVILDPREHRLAEGPYLQRQPSKRDGSDALADGHVLIHDDSGLEGFALDQLIEIPDADVPVLLVEIEVADDLAAMGLGRVARGEVDGELDVILVQLAAEDLRGVFGPGGLLEPVDDGERMPWVRAARNW